MDIRVETGHFAGSLKTIGSAAATVAVGNIVVSIKGLSGEQEEAVKSKYGPFLSDAPPAHTVELFQGDPAYLDMAGDEVLRVQELPFPEGNILLSYDFAGFQPAGQNRGILRLSRPGETKSAQGAIENYLRWTMAGMALERGGFVLHCAGLVREGSAYIFFGPSGAGKSTTTALSAGFTTVLSDDLVLIMKDERGFCAATTPFLGTFEQQAKEKGLYPLKGLFRLIQSDKVEVKRLPKGLAAGMILSCSPFVADPRKRDSKLAPLVEELCDSVPVSELRFRKDPTFWDVILDQGRNNGR